MKNNMSYEQFVLNYLINDIREKFEFETKEKARKYLFAAIAYDTVTAEINDKISYLIDNPKFMEVIE